MAEAGEFGPTVIAFRFVGGGDHPFERSEAFFDQAVLGPPDIGNYGGMVENIDF